MHFKGHSVLAGAVCLLFQAHGRLASASCIDSSSLPPLLDATLDELRAGLDAGCFTSTDLTKAYIARINEVNHELHTVTELNPDALAIAAELDRARQTAAKPLGPLHGIPILIKNNIGTADRMNNTAGSTALLGATLREDSTVARKLRRAGAVILGKANMSQWAGYRSLVTSNGWSAHGGQTHGAYLREQDPSGSSSGSGVAASLGLAWAALGTETLGSICNPSHANNVVGIKPTVGLTSRFLVIPVSEHHDTVGPMARTVKDAAHLLQAIAGADSRDNYTEAAPSTPLPDYVAACREDALQGRRLGVPRAYRDLFSGPALPEQAYDAFEKTFALLRAAGAEIVEDVELPGLPVLRREARVDIVSGADFLTDLPRYLSRLAANPNDMRTLADVRAFTEASAVESSRYDSMVFNAILKRGMNNTAPIWWDYYTRQRYLGSDLGLAGALRNRSLDAVILPTPMAAALALEGSPVVSVPLGATGRDTPWRRNEADTLNSMGPNMPFGFGFAGGYFDEEKLVGMAYALEQRTKVRGTVRPHVQPRTELRDVVAALESEEL